MASTKPTWWPRGEWEHGDPFPVPCPRDLSLSWRLTPRLSSATFGVKRRVVGVVRELNLLVNARASSNSQLARASLPSRFRATNLQRSIVDSICRRVEAYQEPPAGLTPLAAFRELLETKGFYSLEPKHLATYQKDKLRVAKGDVVPKPARLLVPPHAAVYLDRFDTFIEKTAAEISDLDQSGALPEPYWDPVLASNRAAKIDLFRTLLRIGIMGAHLQIKQRVGVFFVRKKDGRIRMVVDARRVNLCHRRPPHTRLAGPIAWRQLDLSHLHELR